MIQKIDEGAMIPEGLSWSKNGESVSLYLNGFSRVVRLILQKSKPFIRVAATKIEEKK